jgi:hypothetical protein
LDWTCCLLAIAAPPALPAPKVLDDFDDIAVRTLVLSDQVSGSLRPSVVPVAAARCAWTMTSTRCPATSASAAR